MEHLNGLIYLHYLITSLRPKQWVKNLFIFLPMIFGKKLFISDTILNVAGAFCLFSLSAGVVYLINDIFDIEKDRLHPTKRLRPIASGEISIKNTLIAVIILGFLSIALAFKLNKYFGFIVITYIVFNLIYSKILKELVIIDVFCIGVFFFLRVLSGGVVAEVRLSPWIIIMTILLALFLGFNKRRQELGQLGQEAIHYRGVLAKYNLYFIDQMIGIITCSMVIAYMLYTVDPGTVREFGSRNLMLSIPFVYYGIFRYLYLLLVKKKDGDPTLILLSDRMMQVDIVLWIIVCAAVIYF